MLASWNFRDNLVYSVWIHSSQYIVVLSYEQDFSDVVEAVRDHTNAQGLLAGTPLICLNSFCMEREAMESLLEVEGNVTLVLD